MHLKLTCHFHTFSGKNTEEMHKMTDTEKVVQHFVICNDKQAMNWEKVCFMGTEMASSSTEYMSKNWASFTPKQADY